MKGCPSYDEIRQPSMDNFDLNKYQGLWYEHKFHDWTQFKEVYDTTLDIKVSYQLDLFTEFDVINAHTCLFGSLAHGGWKGMDRRFWSQRPCS